MITEALGQRIMKVLAEMSPSLKMAEDRLKAHTSPGCRYIGIPIWLDGVVDRIRYNVKAGRFDRLEIFVAEHGVTTADWLPEGSAYCGESRIEIIDLEKGWNAYAASRKENTMDKVTSYLNCAYHLALEDIEEVKRKKQYAAEIAESAELNLKEIMENAEKYGVTLFGKEEWKKMEKDY